MNGAVMKIRFSTSFVAAMLAATCAVTLGAQQAAKTEPPKPTPRTADGHPDLSGVWIAGNRGIRPASENSSIKVVLPLAGVNQDKDNVFDAMDRISVAERAKDENKPKYKPALISTVNDVV